MNKDLHFKPLKKVRLYEEVVDQIKQAIYDGDLKAGDRLPSERELGRMFSVGRPTIREALRTLSVMDLIEIFPGFKGSTIKKAGITQYLDAIREQISWLIRTDEETLQELWAVRKYIELGVAHAAADNATREDFNKLEELIEKMEACSDDIEAYFHLAVEFHRQLALASKNKIFFMIWEIFHDILLKGYIPILHKLFPKGPSKLFNSNIVLLNAIKTKDPDAIDKAMEKHADEEKFFTNYTHPEKRDEREKGKLFKVN